MTDIERMAREAGMHQDGDSWYCVGPGKYDDHDVSTEALTRFAALVRAQALEDAARAIASITRCSINVNDPDFLDITDDGAYCWHSDCAAAIRALGDTK